MADNTDWKARAEAAESAVGVLLDLIRRMPQTLVAQPGKASSEMAQTLADLGLAAAARDARLREEGRREGIEEAARFVGTNVHQTIATAIRALLDKPAGEDGR